MGAINRMKDPEAKSHSIAQKLSNISKEMNISYRYVSINFFIERMISRILTTPLKDKLIFKGGYVGLRVYNSKRYTVDLDAVLQSIKDKKRLELLQKAIESDIGDGVWFKLERQENLPLQTVRGGIKQVYRVGLGISPENITKSAIVQLDIGFGDSITPNPIDVKTSSILEEGEISWKVYPVEAIIAEKLHAFICRDGGSSRAKDLYDLSFYLPQAKKEKLKLAIKSCFKYRKTALPENLYEAMKTYEFSLVRRAWNKVTSVLSEKVHFETCLNTVLENLKRLRL